MKTKQQTIRNRWNGVSTAFPVNVAEAKLVRWADLPVWLR
jgi:hypothetical protein